MTSEPSPRGAARGAIPLVRVYKPGADESLFDFLHSGRYAARVIAPADVSSYERTNPSGTTWVVDGVTLWIEPRTFFSS